MDTQRVLRISGLLGVMLLLLACADSATTPAAAGQPIAVTLVAEDGHWSIRRGGQPYFIKGAGGSADLAYLAASGGNSVRTWSTAEAQSVLDTAHEQGLTVMLGLRLGKERHGFDYADNVAVAAQKQRVREAVLKYRGHPALLAWAVGNEVDLQYTDTSVWYAVEDIAAMIQRLDPHHLVTTVTVGIDRQKADLIAHRVPSIDFLSINMYGELETLPARLDTIGYRGPYVVTEWGPTGHWEVDKTDWGAPIEQTSREKAASYRLRYEQGIAAAPGRALGSYAFLWGQKQETTPTWYGVFTEAGEANEVVDTLTYLWRGEWPDERAPSITAFTIEGQRAADSVVVDAGAIATASVDVVANHNEPLSLRWELLPESTDIKSGGDPESRPAAVSGRIIASADNGEMQFRVPETPGAYRLFVYAQNGHGKVANANQPFFVRAP